MQSPHFLSNRKRRRDAMLRKMSAMRDARARKRLAGPAPERPLKMVRFHALEFCIRDKRTGEMSSWHDLRSARRIAKQAALLLAFVAGGEDALSARERRQRL